MPTMLRLMLSQAMSCYKVIIRPTTAPMLMTVSRATSLSLALRLRTRRILWKVASGILTGIGI